ncbi:Acyl-CoA dehydrogenase apdG (Aspyridones biosynthesis protein G), partial [Durusdinium trenchii]
VSKFAQLHPGGAKVLEEPHTQTTEKAAVIIRGVDCGSHSDLQEVGGKDVTEEFYELHRHDVLGKYERLKVGKLEGDHVKVTTGTKGVPFAEIPAFQGQESPFYTESHKKFMKERRVPVIPVQITMQLLTTQGIQDFVNAELVPIAAAADLKGALDDEIVKASKPGRSSEYPTRELQMPKLGQSGVMASRMGPGHWMDELGQLGISVPGGINPKEIDYFHESIAHQEIARIGLPGFVDGLGAGYLISAPAVYHFGSEPTKRKVCPQLLRGEKWTSGDERVAPKRGSALAISEPFAGSDVAQIKATATRTADGKHFLVNGVKKWITEGAYSDYFVTAVRTGGPGGKGISLLLIERGDGVTTSQMKTTYSKCAGTALIVLDDVLVPVENLMGKENEGFKLIMYNFNHERWFIVQNLLGQMRAALTDAFMWARQRKVFGKPLMDQAVIRNKLASSLAAMESVQSFSEVLTYDMNKHGPVSERLSGPIAMLKFQATRTAWKVADDTVQILGGRGVTHTGMGSKVEGLKNFAKYAAVYGGSEEIMADLTVKQAMRVFPKTARL